jgi:DMSO/TMAO reductase YedYZ molybdopterin-dependent catalytic subunit
MRRTSLAVRVFFLAGLFAAPACGQASQPTTAPRTTTAPATLTVGGDIPSRFVLNAEDLLKMPREKVSVPDQDGTKVEYEGVPLREILKRAGAPMDKDLRGKALASYILAKASDGYEVVFTLAEVAPDFANEPILVADRRDGKALFGYQGPFRLVCPNDKAGARSVRMLNSIEVVRLEK